MARSVSAYGPNPSHRCRAGLRSGHGYGTHRKPATLGRLARTCGLGWARRRTRAVRTGSRRRHQRAEGDVLTTASYSAAVFASGHRRYDDALAAATEAADFDELAVGGWALVELVEAAARRGRPDAAAFALERLSDRTSRIGSDWALGTEARCRALLSDDRAAEDLYREAIERLKPTRIKTELARAELVYGEWLRRQGRRLDARTLLRASRKTFTAMSADAFAERAHLELLATGETARSRSVDTQMQLTRQEARVAVLARDGLTNPEIGERLFVSPKTVEYHLHKVFAKLGIKSRNELHLALANGDSESLLAYLPSPQDESGGLEESQCA
jgi:DNA-binding CsgD family transcriptional regulator